MNIIVAILVLALLILVHEYGHFLAARREGIQIQEFSIGFGPRLGGTQKDGILYSIRALPLGGYVRMLGENLEDDASDPESYMAKSPLQKIRVAFAGPFFNFLLAILLFVYSFTFVGTPVPSNKAVIGEAISGKPAYKAGLKTGDVVKSVNGVQVVTWDQLVAQIQKAEPGKPIKLVIARRGETRQLTIVPEISDGRSMLGIRSQVTFKKLPVVKGVTEGFRQTFYITGQLLAGLGQLLTGKMHGSDLAGPIGITKMIGDAAAGGMVYLINFSALLSVNLGILNLLPIPALDGSKIVFSLIEAVRRKPIEPEKENFVHLLGFIFLIGLTVLVTYNDIVRLLKG